MDKALKADAQPKKPTLVLLHGFAEDHRIWSPQVAALGNEYSIHTPDLPGTGGMAFPTDTSIEGLAEAVYRQLVEAGIEKPIVLGHSMGGYITLALVERHPDYVRAWGLIHSTSWADSAAKKEARQKSIGIIEQYGGAAFLRQMIPALYSEQFRTQEPEHIERMIERYQSIPDNTLVAYYRAMMDRPDRSETLRRAKVPVLMVAGQHDTAVPYADSLQQAAVAELTYLTLLKNSAHMGMWEESEQLNQSIRNFVEAVHSIEPTL